MRDPNDLTPNRRRFLRYLAGSPLLLSSGCWEPRTAEEPQTPTPSPDGAERFGYRQFPRMPVNTPEDAADVFDFRLVAEQNLPPAHYGYIATGVDGEGTLAANRRALENVGIRARRLVNVSDPDMSVELFGRQWTSPIGIAPCGSQKAFHPEGEVAVARAARTVDHLQLLSTVTTSGVEEVNEARGEGVWYQLYPTTSFEVTKQLVGRAEAAGCPAVVLTVDLPAGSNRITTALAARLDPRECEICHVPGFANYVSRKSMFDGIEVEDASGRSRFAGLNDPSLTWDVVKRLRDATNMKVLLKGIVTAEDAELCLEYGVDGIVVSNHGGRAEESGIGTIDSLPEVAEVIGGRIPVIMDSGIRRGVDIFKALALGADAILIGRAYLWGLAAFGQAGVEAVLRTLRAELKLAMQLAGTPRLSDIGPRSGPAPLIFRILAAGGLAGVLAAGGAGAAQPRFADVTAHSGAAFTHRTGRGTDGRPNYFMPEIMGSGVALFDQDGDGDLDLYLVQGEGADQLFENRGPGIRFVEAPELPSVDAYGMGVAAGDADGDGDLDVFRTGFGRDVLLLNSGPGGFRASDEGPWDESWSASATFCDYDADGRLDLFVTRYLDYDPGFPCFAATGEQDYCNPTDAPGLPDLLYRNRGDGRFVEVARDAGIAALPARGLGVVCQDFTGDGRLDFYVANDTESNHLWVNQGDGTFTEEALLLGAALSGFGRPEAGMGVDIGDLSGDGVLDILLTHFADETNTVYLAEPGIGFVDGSIDLGLGTLGLRTTGFGVALGDFDLDGLPDAVIANGRVARPLGESPRAPFFEQYAEPALVLRGGRDRFRDAGAMSPELSQRAVVGRGLAAGDLDGDGDLDLLVSAVEGPVRVFENDSSTEGGWLVVETRLPSGAPDHGAAVVLRTTAGTRIARANPGVSYLSSGDPRAHFGIPAGAAIERLEVRWSDGSEEIFPTPPPDRVVVVVRGEGDAGD